VETRRPHILQKLDLGSTLKGPSPPAAGSYDGRTMPGPGSSEGDRRSPSSPLVHRQVVLLVVLCAVAVVLFALTRSLASWSQETMAREAAAAYTRGVAAERAGELTRAIEEFRRAVFNDRDNRTYTLHLARVLADGGHRDEAERLLLRLREAAPDDSEINYRLARLAAFRHDVQTAVRYYNHAMYGLAADGATLDRRRIRVELIHVLLDAGDREAALPELTALSRELPDEVEAQLEAGRLSARAGQTRVALERFRQAAAIDPTHAEAQVGAGASALALYDFRAAIQHFDAALRLGAGGDRLASNLAVARLADASDPLAPALPIAERARRLDAGFDWLAGQVEACPAADIRAPADVQTDRTPAEGDRPEALPDSDVLRFGVLRSQPQRALRDSDVIAEGVGLIGRLHATVTRVCPGEAPISQAWTLIAQAHPGEVR
jgi:Flp pilus assembly protein TadD